MLSSLFVNVCIFVTFLFFSGVLSKKYVIGSRPLTLPVKINSGLLFGLYGMILMNYSFPVGPHVIADMRHLTVVVIGVYMGWLPALLCSVVLGIGRIALYGWSPAALIACLGMLVVGLSCAYLSTFSWSRLFKMNMMNLASMAVIFVTLSLNLDNMTTVMKYYPTQLIISVIACLFLYVITEHIDSSNVLFAQLEKRATTDHLTQLNNLRQFEWSLHNEMAGAKLRAENLSLLAIDIDHFKLVNDTYGHAAGDEVLRDLGKILLAQARPMGIVSRNGGEEFTVLLPNCSSALALATAEKIRKAVQANVFKLPALSQKKLRITVSIGAATYPADTEATETENALVEQADKALYQAKNSGRNKVCSASVLDLRPAHIVER
ncbi:GGDEF domain-containing protein [Paenibacillus sp. J23TS9]|uniref:GGDEF domain-containing protein n=1 Tax=Paenibacillus sp. J23TS9 TaxID=2807193 RepID=UPI001B2851EF|nr:diguanylate cyclase [Paenibacillus sp. J23TS9]GIP28811.1 GGDEF domain-containing protein [Paenibacillus sp. J23TS9]